MRLARSVVAVAVVAAVGAGAAGPTGERRPVPFRMSYTQRGSTIEMHVTNPNDQRLRARVALLLRGEGDVILRSYTPTDLATAPGCCDFTIGPRQTHVVRLTGVSGTVTKLDMNALSVALAT